jgi:hypothetical protein
MARRGDVAHAQGHANTDFVAALRGGVDRDAVDANGYENQSDAGKNPHQKQSEARLRVLWIACGFVAASAVASGPVSATPYGAGPGCKYKFLNRLHGYW